MSSLELSEIQAYLLNDYKEMGCSKYYLMQVNDNNKVAAKKFIGDVANSITHAHAEVNETCLNLGFTSNGLKQLGYSEANMHTFSREFREGMVSPHRQRLLGDYYNSDPVKWQWGGPANDRVDMILMVFGKDETTADNYFQELKQKFEPGFSVVHILDGKPLPNEREHFGFRDGISQPVIKGSGEPSKGFNNDINPGEFVLGYKNEYEVFPDSPLLVDDKIPGNKNLLADDPSGSSFKDIGRNGTYFVLRQLEQDVDGFWKFLKEKSKDEHGKTNNDEATKIAAKMMGRWPSGSPLVNHPDKDPYPGMDSDFNDFSYIKEDKDGLKCPFGSHIRRMNPRDHFEESTPGVSLKLTRRHRIMRRVRSYGEDFIGSAENHTPNGKVGLLFGCFNANISKQFEFLQYTWANSPKFKKLYDDPDPIIGLIGKPVDDVIEKPKHAVKQNFTIPQETVNKVITDLESFVTVKGGGYFFFPSVTVIKFLGSN
jgi:Dyp-type peroxidase family